MKKKHSGILSRRLVEFCRFLRANDFQIGTHETIDTLQTVRAVTIADRQTLKFGLRALLSSSHEEYELFDRLFEQFWNPAAATEPFCRPRLSIPEKAQSPEGRFSSSINEETIGSKIEAKETTGASALERLKKTDFTKISASDLPQLEEIAFRLWKQMSMRLVRRWRLHGQDGPLDLRHTIRHSISHGGEPAELRYKGRKRKRLHLVTLLDVSGSMDLYSTFLLRFLYVLHKYFQRVDSFLFSTRLTHISSMLRQRDLATVLNAMSQNVEDWSGGTRIGECLKTFNQYYARKILTRNSLVIILSDGWDTGAPEALATEIQAIKRRVRKLIWLNPLLGLQNYQPLTRGMAAALPFADVFAPAHNVQSLLNLETHFR